MADHGNVVVVSSAQHFKEKVEEAKGAKKIVVIDFTATWCPPCRFIAPVFEALSKQFPDVVFLKVDVDEQKEVAQEYNVSAMPTFAFLKDGVKVDEIIGADKTSLETKVVQYATSV
ncbi:Thioredoxin [Rhynchospora pubera]|uniref:Thioredoxin n=1 Tax=Rhynchospora pubera TaxID=906938 RepID=A0AAV8DSP6_9POAL|nr:Thioredoxin [Rhynchospora pubera]